MRVALKTIFVMLTLLAALMAEGQSATKYRISNAELGQPVRYNSSSSHFVLGDTWSIAWTTDQTGQDVLYTSIDDTFGFNNEVFPKGCKDECGRNLAIASFGNTAAPNLTGHLVNDMRAFGLAAQSSPGGPPGEAWKANGLTALNGVLYLSVSRHCYGQRFFDFRQRAYDSTIVKSSDQGKNWAPLPPRTNERYAQPMFAGPKFGTPAFVHFGRDGKVPNGIDPADRADEYVYATSTDGFWDNGDALYMGRVQRSNVTDPSSWEFVTAFDAAGNPVWKGGPAGLDAATPILSEPGRISLAGIQYIPAAGLYILPEWYYPELGSSCDPNPNRPLAWENSLFSDPDRTCVRHSSWQFYEAPHPWGPWKLFFQKDFSTEGFYNPAIIGKSVSTVDANGIITFWIITTGNFATGAYDWDKTDYTAFLLPMKLKLDRPDSRMTDNTKP